MAKKKTKEAKVGKPTQTALINFDNNRTVEFSLTDSNEFVIKLKNKDGKLEADGILLEVK